MWEITPNPGIIKIYTSGWPKNQNKCWYKMGSPPPAGSKNDLLKFRSVNSIVIAPARTGRDNKSKIVVTNIAQMNSGICSYFRYGCFMLMIVVIKLIDAMMDEIPAICSDKIIISIEWVGWNRMFASGG